MTGFQRLSQVQINKVPERKLRNKHKILPLSYKLFGFDACWERETLFYPMKCHPAYQIHFKTIPHTLLGWSWPTKNRCLVLCTLFILFGLLSLCLFVLIFMLCVNVYACVYVCVYMLCV